MSAIDTDALLVEWDVARDRSIPEPLQALETALFLEDTFGVAVPDEAIDPAHLADVTAMRALLAGLQAR